MDTQVKAREVVSVDEKTELDEKPAIKFMKSITKYMVEGVKEKKKKIPPQTSLKSTDITKK